jgi:hypothetical protein
MLAAWLRSRGIDHRLVEVHRLTLYSILGRFIKRWSPSRGQSLLQEHYSLYHQGSRRRAIGKLRCLFFWIDVLAFCVWVRLFLDRRRRVIICDRSLLDEAVQLAYLGFCGEGAFTRRLRSIPRVARSFLLAVPPGTAYERNPEYPMEHFAMKDRFYGLATEITSLTPLPVGNPDEVHESIVRNVAPLLWTGV